MNKSLLALAFGTFAFGVSEFVMMGILPYLADDFGIGIAEAGHFISVYAIGVCVGAPLVAAFARRLPLKHILYMLMGIYALAAASMALCPLPSPGTGGGWQYWLMIGLRFLAGTPHGAYFGVSAVVGDRLSPQGKSAFAVAIICSGMTVANLMGNPLCTLVTSLYSWRAIFAFTTAWGLLTWLCIARWVPHMEALPDHGLKGEFRFLKTLAPWLLFVCTAMGNSGIFSWYSYISPTLTQLAGVSEGMMMLMIVLAGAGMVVGNLMGGRLSDRFGPGHTGRGIEVVIMVALLLTSLTTHMAWCAVPLMVLTTACLFALSSPQQLLLLRFSKGGELMGGAMVQIAFNLGNAIGAWCGGLTIDEADPTSYHYPAAVGACFAAVGIVSYMMFCRRYERRWS